ncbi:hypothetical protein SAMN05216324_11959 [Chryseobacterium limigenitum]|uniref:Uncharacterized protein n=1 Tax=Chryseobacterium limigenitum TaxID=1612149 RepID=A0A1K2IXC0_9FLAO|nr:hypothetical protein SAMN05216324_11959 [Chryseobacterium limigenitum]
MVKITRRRRRRKNKSQKKKKYLFIKSPLMIYSIEGNIQTLEIILNLQ